MRCLHFARLEDRHEFCWSRGFLALDQACHAYDIEAEVSGSLHGLDGGASGGAYVVHDHHARAFIPEAFNALACAVSFFSFTHQEAVHHRVLLCADDGNRDYDWVGTHGHPAHGFSLPGLLLQQVKKNVAGQFRALRMKRGGTAVNVVITLDAGSQGKFTETKRVFCQQAEELVAGGLAHVSDIRNRKLGFPQMAPEIAVIARDRVRSMTAMAAIRPLHL